MSSSDVHSISLFEKVELVFSILLLASPAFCLFISSTSLELYMFLMFLFLNQNIYVVGIQKNCLNETVLLSTQNMC